MKCLVTIVILLIALTGFSQNQRIDFSRIDRRVQSIRPALPLLLSQELTAGYTTELEKVRAIFRWIADNIEYRTKIPQPKKKKFPVSQVPVDDSTALKPLDELVAESVLEKGTAVCDGYARLFKTLCFYAGIRSELITGYARTESFKSNRRFRSNHTWNAVMIDGVWKLLDVTWASGFISWQGNQFIRYFDEEYFLTDPAKFIREHYPDDLSWSLMTDPPVLPEFHHSPYKQKSFVKYSITAFRPAKGIIEASLGDTIQVELEIANAEKDRRIGGDPFLDTSIYKTPQSVLLVPSTVLSHKALYSYYVDSPLVQWVYILYNDDVVLRYKLVIRKEKPALAVSGTHE